MARILMKGNEAIAEAAVRAGVEAFFGYPITPQNEVPEYLARELPKHGATYLQSESELAGANMLLGASAAGGRVMTSTSGPGLCLMLEAMSSMALTRLPAWMLFVPAPAWATWLLPRRIGRSLVTALIRSPFCCLAMYRNWLRWSMRHLISQTSTGLLCWSWQTVCWDR